MTVEEIDIIVKAKVKEALEDLKRIEPEITKIISNITKKTSSIDFSEIGKKASDSLKSIDFSSIISKTQKAVEKTKNISKKIGDNFNNNNFQSKIKNVVEYATSTINKLKEIKIENKNNDLKVDINIEEAESQISQLEKEIESLQKQITSRELKLQITNDSIENLKLDERNRVRSNNNNLTDKEIYKEADFNLGQDSNYNSLIKQSDKLNSQIEIYGTLLESAKKKLEDIKNLIGLTESAQNDLNQEQIKSSTSINDINKSFKSSTSNVNNLKKVFLDIGKAIKNVALVFPKIFSIVKKLTPSLSSGMKNLLKYIGALFSIRSIYNILRGSASSWLSSQNAQAQQLSANIEYMKYAMGSLFAPVIEYVINLVYQLMRAIQNVAYALTGVNIFAKATATSMKNTANNAQKASKSLSGIHNEINNVSDNNGDNFSPNIDLSGLDGELTPLQQKLIDFFKPLLESWDKYSPSLIEKAKKTFSEIGYLISSLGKSFINLFTNGTIYTSLEEILSIIGHISEAFANAWNYHGNGDKVVQNLADAFNNLLASFDKLVESPKFQEFLNLCSDKIKEISDKLSQINWQPLIDALFEIGSTIGLLALDVINSLVNAFKWIVEHPGVIEVILGIYAALKLYGMLSGIIGFLTKFKKTTEEISKAGGISADFTGFLNGLGKAAEAIAILGGISIILGQVIDLIEAFSESSISLSQVAILLGTVLGELALAFVAIAAASNLMNIEGILGVVVVLGGLALVINQITGLIDSFSQSGTSLNNVIGLMSSIFLTIVGLMGSIVLLGPLMTAGLGPFLVVVAGLSATLLVMAATLPTILEATSEFIQNTAPSLALILTTIGDIINKIINSIGVILPPIIESTGNLFSKIFSGISQVINSVGNVLTNILNALNSLVVSVLSSILNFINQLGPAINNFVDNAISATTKIINFLISGIEYLVNTLIVGGVNSIISAINSISKYVGINIPRVSGIYIPRFIPAFDKGNVAYKATLGLFGEYSGAREDPEITSPKSIMYDTMLKAISDSKGGNGEPIYITVNLGTKEIGRIVINELKELKRKTGKDLDVLIN